MFSPVARLLKALRMILTNVLLRDIQRGDLQVMPGKTFKDYIMQYQTSAHDNTIHAFAERFGLDETLLRQMPGLGLTGHNLNEFDRFDKLKQSADKTKAKAFF